MRISDWSSDVCSSDLVQKRLRVDRQRLPVAGADRGGLRLADVPAADRRRLFRADYPGARARLRDPANQPAGHDRRLQRPDRLSHAARLQPRSEEHTSELQSLMRISYAVFCLKKKNNKQHTIQEHRTQYILTQPKN